MNPGKSVFKWVRQGIFRLRVATATMSLISEKAVAEPRARHHTSYWLGPVGDSALEIQGQYAYWSRAVGGEVLEIQVHSTYHWQVRVRRRGWLGVLRVVDDVEVAYDDLVQRGRSYYLPGQGVIMTPEPLTIAEHRPRRRFQRGRFVEEGGVRPVQISSEVICQIARSDGDGSTLWEVGDAEDRDICEYQYLVQRAAVYDRQSELADRFGFDTAQIQLAVQLYETRIHVADAYKTVAGLNQPTATSKGGQPTL